MTTQSNSTASESSSDADPEPAERAFVLGLDGIPWSLLDRWTDAGELPNLRRIVEEGAAGELASTRPPTTPVAWPSIATGVGPDDHGFYEFMKLDAEHSHRPYNSSDRRVPALWEMLSPAVVGNVPMTYPASSLDGQMISGLMSPELNAQATHPPELAERIHSRVPEYEVGLNWNEYVDRPDELRSDLEELLEARREVMRLLMDEAADDWRLFFFVYTAPDRLQHLIWDEDVLLDHYRSLDEIVGEVMSYCEEHGCTLFVVSDHGFGPIETSVNVNTILAEEGFLTRKNEGGSRGLLTRFGLTKSRVRTAVESTGLDFRRIVRRLPQSMVDRVANQVPGDNALYDVDFAETQAFVHGFGNLYVNDDGRFANGSVPAADRAAVRRDVLETLRDVTDPRDGTEVLDVHDGTELFPDDDFAPDVVVQTAPNYNLESSLTDERFGDVGNKAGNHRPEGIFLAWGPDIEARSTPVDASVVDVLPTVLHSVLEPLPTNVDGRVLDEIFAADSAPATADIEERSYEAVTAGAAVGHDDEEFEDVEERLRGLGYVD